MQVVMPFVILLVILAQIKLHSAAPYELFPCDNSPIPRRSSAEYQEFRDEITLINLKSDPMLWKLLRHKKICELPSEASKPLGWVRQQIEILRTEIGSINEQMKKYESVVWLEPFENTKEQIKAINNAMHSIKKAVRSDEKQEKLLAIRHWRAAAQQKQKLEKLILHLDAFYETEKF
jgi:hypothetical protein